MSETTMFCIACNAHVFHDTDDRTICMHCDKPTSACVKTRPNEIYRKGMRLTLIRRGVREHLYYNIGITNVERRNTVKTYLQKQRELYYKDIDYDELTTKVLEAIFTIENIKID